MKTITVLILLSVVLVLSGCNEAQRVPVPAPDVKPIEQHLIPTKAEWKVAYGDTIETQVAFNLALIRYDQGKLFQLVQQLHPKPDPNEVAK